MTRRADNSPNETNRVHMLVTSYVYHADQDCHFLAGDTTTRTALEGQLGPHMDPCKHCTQ